MGAFGAERGKGRPMSSFLLSDDRNCASFQQDCSHHDPILGTEHMSLTWIDHPAVRKELEFVDSSAEFKDGDKALQTLLRKVLDCPDQRRFVLAPCINSVQALSEQFPNFAQVVESVLGELALQLSACAKPRRLTPLLLLGDPGIGKTLFAKTLASQLGVNMELVSLSTATSGFMLAGMDSAYSGDRDR